MNSQLYKNLNLINKTVLECVGAISEREIIKRFIATTVTVLKADYGYSFMWDNKGQKFYPFYMDPKTPFISKTPRKSGVTAKTFKTKQPQYFSHAGKDASIRDHAKKYMRGVVVIPISYKRTRFGTLDICFYKEHNFTEEEKILCQFIGNSTAQALTISRLYRDMEQRVIERTWQLERSKAEISVAKAKDEAVLSSIGDGVIVTDLEGTVLVVNESAEQMLQIKKSEVVGKKWWESVEAQDEDGQPISEEERPLRNALAGNTVNSVHYYKRKDKTIFPAAVTDSPVRLSGQIIGAVLVFRDISKEIEIDKAKTEFVSLASHQLRTPLAAINWYTEALLSQDLGGLNEKQQQYGEEIKKSNSRMIDLVNDLLNVSRIELGTFVFSTEHVHVAEIADSALRELENIAEKKSITIQKRLDTPELVHTDPKLLKMVFQNLISNAIKYTPTGGTIAVTAEYEEMDRVHGVLITIKDNGYGVPKHQYDKIFTKLFRADNVKTKEPDGTGLGLYILKSMLGFCGGRIWFESKEGKGSKFFVFIPAEVYEQSTSLGSPNK